MVRLPQEKIMPLRDVQSRLLALLHELSDVLGRLGISWCASDGTLLGAIRNSGFIPWDDDIDIYVRAGSCGYDKLVKHFEEFAYPYRFRSADVDKLVGNRLVGSSCSIPTVWFPDGSHDLPKVFDTSTTCISGGNVIPGIYADIFQLEYCGDGTVRNTIFKYDRFPEECFSKVLPYRFEDITVPVPAGYDTILTKQYGDYKIEKRSHRHFECYNVPYCDFVRDCIGTIKVNYTCYCVNDWETVFSNHMKMLNDSVASISNVSLTVFAYPITRKLFSILSSTLSSTSVRCIVVDMRSNKCEYPAVLDLINNHNEVNLYFHSKGVSKPCGDKVKPAAQRWNAFMSRFNIGRARDCIDMLFSCDCCGVQFSGCFPRRYEGNFWWATGEHLDRLSSSHVLSNLRADDRDSAENILCAIPGSYGSIAQIHGHPCMYTTEYDPLSIERRKYVFDYSN